MGKLEFARRFVHVEGKPILFDGRPYLPAIYSARRNVVLRCSRQTEKSTFLANTIIYEACVRPGIQMMFVCPRLEQARMFSRTRLLKVIEQSPLVARRLTGQHRTQVPNLHFDNGSSLFIRAAYHAVLARSSCSSTSFKILPKVTSPCCRKC
jgi:phage terminase large subunit GpA-like protein